MNLNYFKTIALYTILIITILSCKKNKQEEQCISYTLAPVTNVTGGNTALINQELNLTVSFLSINGCGQFENIEESSSGNTTTLKINAKYEGCVCTQDVSTKTTFYKFKKAEAGIYELKFSQPDSTFYNYTITVQ